MLILSPSAHIYLHSADLTHTTFAPHLFPNHLSNAPLQYIDLDYQGEGIGEYQFFDRFTGEWDTSSCIAGERPLRQV